jgi:hypothetical protein
MTTAAAFGLTGVYDLNELGLLPAVLDEQEVGDELVRRYITPLGNGDAAETLLETVRHYLKVGMRADIAAKQLFVHHNTVRYRLRRYEDSPAPTCATPIAASKRGGPYSVTDSPASPSELPERRPLRRSLSLDPWRAWSEANQSR